MKRTFSIFLVLTAAISILASLAACGGGSATPKPGIVDGGITWTDPSSAAGRRPISGIIVKVWNASDEKVGEAVSREDGRFSIYNIAPGTYTVTGQAPADAIASEEKRWLISGVTVLSEKTRAVDLNYQNSIGTKLPEKYLQ